MNHVSFATALVKLSRHQIGICEASMLFILGNGSTLSQICDCLNLPPTTIKARAGVLREKGMVIAENRPGTKGYYYKPTEKGRAIIHDALSEPKRIVR